MAVRPIVTDFYMEAKRNQAVSGMKHVEKVVLDVAKEFAEMSGREYGLFEALQAGKMLIVQLS